MLFVMGFSFVVQASSLTPELEKTRNHIMNARFSKAKETINTFLTQNPTDPRGYLLRGIMREWDQVINNKRRKYNPLILADYQKANELAFKNYYADKKNEDKQVLLGNTYLYLAKKQLDKGEKFSAGMTLKRAKNIMLEVIKKNPDNHEAYMALGVFNYFAEKVPNGFKWLASILGFSGSKSKGIAYLKKAASSNNLTQADAGILLIFILSDREKQHLQTIPFIQNLIQNYPGNPSFRYELGEKYFRGKKVALARNAFQNFFSFCKKNKALCSNKYKFLANYFLTWSYMDQKKYKVAKTYLKKAVKLNDKQYKDRNVDLDLWSGIVALKSGDQKAADRYFDLVKRYKKRNPSAWKKAQPYLKK